MSLHMELTSGTGCSALSGCSFQFVDTRSEIVDKGAHDAFSAPHVVCPATGTSARLESLRSWTKARSTVSPSPRGRRHRV